MIVSVASIQPDQFRLVSTKPTLPELKKKKKKQAHTYLWADTDTCTQTPVYTIYLYTKYHTQGDNGASTSVHVCTHTLVFLLMHSPGAKLSCLAQAHGSPLSGLPH